MNKFILFVSALLSGAGASAQSHSLPAQGSRNVDTIDVHGEKMWIGKEIDGKQLKKRIDEANSQFYGTQHRGFRFTTTTGEDISSGSSSDRVSLFAMWDPTCHYKLDKLNELQKQYENNKDIQVVVVTFDTTGLAQMITDEKLDLKFAMVRDASELNKVGYGNGYPSYIIMAKDNVIRGLGSLHDWEECMGVLKKVL